MESNIAALASPVAPVFMFLYCVHTRVYHACAHTHTESGKREERMSSGNCSSVDGDLDNEHFWVVCLNQGYLSVQTLLPLAL